MDGIGAFAWGLIVIGGAAILFVALVVGTMAWRRRRRDPAVQVAQDRAVDRLYHEGEEK